MAFDPVKLHQVQVRIKKACLRSGRNPEHIRLLAATKYASVEDMNASLKAGILLIGENKIQDADRKFSFLNVPEGVSLQKHFIGHLQTNKVKQAVQLFDVIESVDSLHLAGSLDIEAAKSNRVVRVLVEVNIAEDQKKFGVSVMEIPGFLKKIASFRHLELLGFMAIVPFAEDLESVRPFFRSMRELFDMYRKDYRSMSILSMGMSHDFEVAIEEGATEVRVGSLLFR